MMKIKRPKDKTLSVPRDIGAYDKVDYPLFSFKYLQDTSLKGCINSKFIVEFVFRLKKLSELGWKRIHTSHRHAFGMEKIERDSIKPSIPSVVTPEVPLFAFRAAGNNLPFIGFRDDKIFYILFIETSFGDIYNHN